LLVPLTDSWEELRGTHSWEELCVYCELTCNYVYR
jgi:hypothetical protein